MALKDRIDYIEMRRTPFYRCVYYILVLVQRMSKSGCFRNKHEIYSPMRKGGILLEGHRASAILASFKVKTRGKEVLKDLWHIN